MTPGWRTVVTGWTSADHHGVRINEFEDTVAREFFARRETLVAEASRVARGLAAGPDGATPPAVAQVDTVRISAEARAVLNALTGPPGKSLPGPDAIMAAIRQILEAGTARDVLEGVLGLAGLVGRLGESPGGPGPRWRDATFFERLAAAAIRGLEQAGVNPTPVAVARVGALIRALVGEAQAAGGGPGLERSALALYLAATRGPAAARMAGDPGARGAAATRGEGQLPAALHSLAGGGAPAGPTRTRRQRARGGTWPHRAETGSQPGEDALDRESR